MRVVMAVMCSMLVPAAALATESKSQAGDQSFVDRAFSINEGEIELGKLAQKKGSTEQVRAFGQRMERDHRTGLKELRDVVAKDNLKMPVRLQSEETDLYKRLAKLDGKVFDDAYIDHMVSGHKDAIRAFEEEASTGSSSDVRSYAEKMLPTLKAHEALAKRDLQRL